MAFNIENNLNYGQSTVAVTAASTVILVPSAATGCLYITSLVVSNGPSQGSVYFGASVGATAPTGSGILILDIYNAAYACSVLDVNQPVKVPASNNFTATTVSGTTTSLFATWYVAP
jgi:hypothetical protein